jgi:hypothetical protein
MYRVAAIRPIASPDRRAEHNSALRLKGNAEVMQGRERLPTPEITIAKGGWSS